MTPKFGDPALIELIKADYHRFNRGKCPLCGSEWDYTHYKSAHIYSCPCGFYGLEFDTGGDKELRAFRKYLTT